MKSYRKFFLIVTMLLLVPFYVYAQEIRIVHFEFQPLDSEIIKILLKETGLKGEMKIYPWKRAYRIALEEENILIGPFLKTEERETQFKWLEIPLYTVSINFYRLKDREDIKVDSLADARNYRIGSVREYASTKYLLKHGFGENLNKPSASSEEHNIQKLFARRFDILIMSDQAISEKMNKLGLDMNMVENVYTVYRQNRCFAFSNKTSDNIVNRFRAAFDKIKNDGTLEDLKKRYGK